MSDLWTDIEYAAEDFYFNLKAFAAFMTS